MLGGIALDGTGPCGREYDLVTSSRLGPATGTAAQMLAGVGLVGHTPQ